MPSPSLAPSSAETGSPAAPSAAPSAPIPRSSQIASARCILDAVPGPAPGTNVLARGPGNWGGEPAGLLPPVSRGRWQPRPGPRRRGVELCSRSRAAFVPDGFCNPGGAGARVHKGVASKAAGAFSPKYCSASASSLGEPLPSLPDGSGRGDHEQMLERWCYGSGGTANAGHVSTLPAGSCWPRGTRRQRGEPRSMASHAQAPARAPSPGWRHAGLTLVRRSPSFLTGVRGLGVQGRQRLRGETMP